MEQIIKAIVNSQKLRDVGSVVRGADRVFGVYTRLLGKSLSKRLISSEARSFEYLYEEEEAEQKSQEADSTKPFDFGENQPKSYKDLDKSAKVDNKDNKSFQSPQSSKSFSTFTRHHNFQSYKLYNTFGNKFSTTVRSTQKGSNPQPLNDNVNKNDLNQKNETINSKEVNEKFKVDSTRNMQARNKVYPNNLHEKPVPASGLERTASFAGLGIELATNTVGNLVKNILKAEKPSLSRALLTEENAQRISQTFSRMRGIPLKLAQVLSMQEESVVPRIITKALETAQKSANIMPQEQLFQVLKTELGEDWQNKFESFDIQPLAAASIGQVHKGYTKAGEKVAVKIQYPGVIDSIDPDIRNVKRLLVYPNILPRSLFLEDILKHIRKELLEECDYLMEAKKQTEFRNKILNVEGYYTPKVFPELSTKKILTQEFVGGLNLDECLRADLNQEQRNKLGEKVFNLLLIQLFDFGYMQTDPNPANFFYDPEKDVLNLIDFGAAQHFSLNFVDSYMKIIYGTSIKNSQMIYEGNKEVGFLTGEEGRELLEAQVSAVLTIGEPFAVEGAFDFGNQNMADKIYDKLPILLGHRLKPPPQAVYSLHRMLIGGYLMCMKLKAVVPVSKLFQGVRSRYIARGNTPMQ